MNLWTPGKPPIIGRHNNRTAIYAKKDVLEVPGKNGGKVHGNLLSVITGAGDTRVRKYFKVNYIDVNNRVSRSEKGEAGVSLARIATTTAQINQNKRDETVATTSTGKKELMKLLTIDKIIAEIGKLRGFEHTITIPNLPSRSSMDHGKYAAFLVQHRRRVFANNGQLRSQLTEAITTKYNEMENSTREQRSQLLQHPFYALSETVFMKERYHKKYDVSQEPTN